MRALLEAGSRLGSRLGNWNDRANSDPSLSMRRQTRRYKLIDRAAGWLYVLPETHGRRRPGTVTPSFSMIGVIPQVIRASKA